LDCNGTALKRVAFEQDQTNVWANSLPVTPNLDLARRCDRIIEVVDGRIQP
jgi:predicted ABC-type transport system involved in lysophospholipase L1 biosynthesis ATPase subunit